MSEPAGFVPEDVQGGKRLSEEDLLAGRDGAPPLQTPSWGRQIRMGLRLMGLMYRGPPAMVCLILPGVIV